MENSNYNHTSIENEIYNYWEKNNFFKPKKNKKKHFSIVIPPPNVTGSLHMGHALNNSLQDFLIRFHRMNGYETLGGFIYNHLGHVPDPKETFRHENLVMSIQGVVGQRITKVKIVKQEPDEIDEDSEEEIA